MSDSEYDNYSYSYGEDCYSSSEDTSDTCDVCSFDFLKAENVDINSYTNKFIINSNNDIVCDLCDRIVHPIIDIDECYDISDAVKVNALKILFNIGADNKQTSTQLSNDLKIKGLSVEFNKRALENVSQAIKISAIADYIMIMNDRIFRSCKRLETISALLFYSCIYHKEPKSQEFIASAMGIKKTELSRGCNNVKRALIESTMDETNKESIKKRIYAESTVYSQTKSYIEEHVNNTIKCDVIEGINSIHEITSAKERKDTYRKCIIKLYNSIAMVKLFPQTTSETSRINICCNLIKQLATADLSHIEFLKTNKKENNIIESIKSSEYSKYYQDIVLNYYH